MHKALILHVLVLALSTGALGAKPSPALFLNTQAEFFSPNGDGILDIQTFLPDVKSAASVASWSLTIFAQANDSVVHIQKGSGKVPKSLVWKGRFNTLGSKDGEGERAPDGVYRAEFSVAWEKKQYVTIHGKEFVLDTQAPQLDEFYALGPGETKHVADDILIVCPAPEAKDNRTGVQVFPRSVPRLRILQKGSTGDLAWTAQVSSQDGKVVHESLWENHPVEDFVWTGKDRLGALVTDGTYRYTLKATDKAGNSWIGTIPFRMDTLPRTLELTNASPGFSPNGDKKLETMVFRTRINSMAGLESWTFTIQGAQGKVQEWKGAGALKGLGAWDGKDAPEGMYTASLSLSFDTGQDCVAQTLPFALARKLGPVLVSADTMVFSPDNDGRKDRVTFFQPWKDIGIPVSWKAHILDSKGRVQGNWTWTDQLPELFPWDGKVKDKVLPNGTYRYVLEASDSAGNTYTNATTEVVLDIRKPTLGLDMVVKGLSQKGRAEFRTLPLTPRVGIKEGIESWLLEIVPTKGGDGVYQLTGTGLPPGTLEWNGVDSSGQSAPEGAYKARLSLVYAKGNLVSADGPVLVLDNSPPLVDLALSDGLFSPDNDGEHDSLVVKLDLKDRSGIGDWSLIVLDPAGHAFMSWSGRGAPSEGIVWDGRNAQGELVQSAMDYDLVLEASDTWGQVSTKTRKLVVDLLVLKEGSRYRIPLPGIEFPPEGGDLSQVPETQRLRNYASLERLAQLLGKFPAYHIVVEGHANSTKAAKGRIPDQQEQEDELVPLSTARALAVVKHLVGLGIAEERLEVSGLGGAVPVVDFGDREQGWKNRRVEFLLMK